MQYPLVSICIPTYNGVQFIAEAMESAIAQTYPNLEIVVSDDASKDDTLKIIESYKEKTEIPIYIYHHEPNGIGANWNHSVKKAKGDYIKFLFQDDMLMPTCIEKMVTLALSNKNVGLVYCKREIICNNHNRFTKSWLKNFSILHKSWGSLKIEEGTIKGIDYLVDEKFLDPPKNKIGEPPAVLLAKFCFEKTGFFNTKLDQSLDIEYWYRVMPYFNIGFIDEELVKFRLHTEQASQINKTKITVDKELLPKLFLKTIFKFLSKVQKKKLLIEIYKNTLFFLYYNKIKGKIIHILNAKS